MPPSIAPDAYRATWPSPAKVNLCLRVVGRRRDGYHLLDSIFVPIDLCDRITVDVTALRPEGDVTVTIRCSDPTVPTDRSNLVARAATALLTDAARGATVHVDLEKRIPPGTGLGGGSGNAATMLVGLNALLRLGLPAQRLRALALSLGADVPFFLSARPARVRGIGEDVQPIAHWRDTPLVVAIPPVSISTPWAFRTFRDTVALAGVPPESTEAAAIAAGEPVTASLLVNDLEQAVLPAFPAIADLKRRLRDAGATAAVMSGSGSAVVALAPTWTAAEAIAARIGAGGVAAAHPARLHQGSLG